MRSILENKKLDVFKAKLVIGAYFTDGYEFPVLQKTSFVATKAVPFSKARHEPDKSHWVHFYEDDYVFERLWSRPFEYLGALKEFSGVITPDFSLY